MRNPHQIFTVLENELSDIAWQYIPHVTENAYNVQKKKVVISFASAGCDCSLMGCTCGRRIP